MDISHAATAFTALGQATRLEMMRALLAAGPSGIPAGDLADQVGVPSSTLSFHLRALEAAGLVRATRLGRNLIYAAQIAALREIIAFLAEACCGGQPDLCGDLHRLLDSPVEKPTMYNVLFLCTQNSARSIMGEAILGKIGQGRFRAYSAGSNPSPHGPQPEVISQLKALGHDVSGLRSKSWDEFARPDAPSMDFVIALCDTLSGQVCPDFGDTLVTAAWPLPDPTKFSGNTAERATLLNELYAALRRRLDIFISLPFASLDRLALKARVDELAHAHAMAR